MRNTLRIEVRHTSGLVDSVEISEWRDVPPEQSGAVCDILDDTKRRLDALLKGGGNGRGPWPPVGLETK